MLRLEKLAAMSIHCCCQSCQAPLKVDVEHAGRSARCPKCGSVLTIPASPSVDLEFVDSAPDGFEPAQPSAAIPVGIPIGPNADSLPESGDALRLGPTSAAERMRERQRRAVPTKTRMLMGVFLMLCAVAVYGGYVWYDHWQSRPGVLVLDGDSMNLADVLVTVDGKRLGTLNGAQTQFDVEPGGHLLVLRRRGYLPIEKSFRVQRGQQWHLNPVWIRPDGLPLGDPP